MSSDDYHVHNIYRYTRKSYKQNRRDEDVFDNTHEDGAVDSVQDLREGVIERSPRDAEIAEYAVISPDCHLVDPDGDLANILHKKCPVITLAQQQLTRLLDETNKLIYAPDRSCSPLTCSQWCYWRELLSRGNKSTCVLVAMIFVAFFTGLLLGAATCGTRFGKFDNLILNCIDNYFIPDNYLHVKDSLRCIT